MRKKVQVLVLGLVMSGAACGDDERHVVTVRTGVQPALLAFRNEDSSIWQTIDPTGKSVFEIEVSGLHRVVVVCEYTSTAFMISEYARAPSDEPIIENSCQRVDESPFVVRGEMTQPGRAWLGLAVRGQSSAPWSFEFPSAAGTFDLVTLFGDVTTAFDQVAIRRDIVVDGDVELGLIDPAQEHAVPMTPAELVVANQDPEDGLSARVRLASGNTIASIRTVDLGGGLPVKLVPDSALRRTDHQHLRVDTFDNVAREPVVEVSRFVGQTVRAGEPIALALPEPLGPVVFEASGERLTAAWTTLPEYDHVYLVRFQLSNDVIEDALISRAFVEATGVSSASLDFAAIPGFKSGWRVDSTHDHSRQLTAYRGNFLADIAGSQVREDVPGLSREARLAPTGDPRTEARMQALIEAKLR